jgi:esterase/lipase superfamily enzyme/Tfp pilus assembly protein PilF
MSISKDECFSRKRLLIASTALQLICCGFPAFGQPADIAVLSARVTEFQRSGKHDEATVTAKQLVEATKQQKGKDSLEAAAALDVLGSELMQQQKWNDAASPLQEALDIRSKKLPSQHLDVAASLIRLARVKEETSRYTEGLDLAERGLKIREQQLPPKDLDLAIALDLMADLLRAVDKYGVAESYARRAVEIRREIQGPEHVDLARSLVTLGGIYVDSENFKDAEPVIKQAIRILEKTANPDSRLIGTLWFNLGRNYQEQGRYHDAEEAAKTALATATKSLGAESGGAAKAQALLGEIYRSAGNYQLADQELKKAIEIFRSSGPDSGNVADCLFKLAEVHADQGRLGEAGRLHKQALAMRETVSGKASRPVLYSLNALAATMRAMGEYGDAEIYVKQAIDIGRKTLPPHQKNILAASLGILAGIYLDQQRLDDGAAERLAQESLEIRRGILGDKHHEVAASYNALAAINRAKGTPEGYMKSEDFYKQALILRRKNLDPMHPFIASVHNNLGGLYRAWGSEKLEDAEREYKEAIEIYSRGGTVENRSLAVTLANRAALFIEYKRYADAKADIDRAQSIRRKLFGPSHSSIADGLVQLAIIDIGQSRISDAETKLKQALDVHAELEKIGDGKQLEKARVHEQLARLYGSQEKHKPAYEELKLAYELKKERDPGVASTLLLLAEAVGRAGIKDSDKIAEDYRRRASLIKQANLVKRAVLYGTVRKPQQAQDCLAFGNEAISDTTMGQAEITLANDTGKVQSVYTEEEKADQSPSAEIRATRDFLCTKIANVIRDDLIALANQRIETARLFPYQVIVFVHGFNQTFKDALVRAAQISHDIGFDGAVFGFSWASRGGLSSYIFDRNRATTAEANLNDFLTNVVARTKARKIHLVAHSMGSRMLLETLEKIRLRDGDASRLRLGELILVAPDVDRASYLRLIGYMTDLQGKVTVYASSLDRPLLLSGWLGGATAGYVSPREGAVVAIGADTIDVTDAGKMFAFNHFFNENPKVFGDIRNVLLGERPPDRRAPNLLFKTKRTYGEYWIFKQKGLLTQR